MTPSPIVASTLIGALRNLIDVDEAPARLDVYDGAPTSGSVASHTLIAECPLAYPCGTLDSIGVLTLNPGSAALVLSANPPTWGRLVTASGVRLGEVSVRRSQDPSGPTDEVVISPVVGTDTQLVPGAQVQITGGTLNLANVAG